MNLTSFLRAVRYGARRDETGHYYYIVDGVRLYVRSPEECESPEYRRFLLNHVYFKHYRPGGSDCVVDFGAGLGTEIVGLASSAPDVRYIAVEIQPWVYECLCLTLAQLPAGYVPYGLSVGGPVRISPTRYGVDASISAAAAVPVEGVSWAEFVRRHDIRSIDLLKMNIEGAELFVLDQVDLSIVRRAIISAHDFRADLGHGEHFRTRAGVEARLRDAGFAFRSLDGPETWMQSWIYAERAEAG
jgi:FkbM family methyltransferase